MHNTDFLAVKHEIPQKKDRFNIFARNIDRWYTLEPPGLLFSALSMRKIRKK